MVENRKVVGPAAAHYFPAVGRISQVLNSQGQSAPFEIIESPRCTLTEALHVLRQAISKKDVLNCAIDISESKC